MCAYRLQPPALFTPLPYSHLQPREVWTKRQRHGAERGCSSDHLEETAWHREYQARPGSRWEGRCVAGWEGLGSSYRPSRSLQVPPDQLPSAPFRSLLIPSDPSSCPQIPTAALRSLQIPTDALGNSSPAPTDPPHPAHLLIQPDVNIRLSELKVNHAREQRVREGIQELITCMKQLTALQLLLPYMGGVRLLPPLLPPLLPRRRGRCCRPARLVPSLGHAVPFMGHAVPFLGHAEAHDSDAMSKRVGVSVEP